VYDGPAKKIIIVFNSGHAVRLAGFTHFVGSLEDAKFYFILFYFILFYFILFFSVALRPSAGHGLLILDVSRSHTTTRHNR